MGAVSPFLNKKEKKMKNINKNLCLYLLARLLSTLIKEVSFRIEMKPTERSIASQNAEKKMNIISHTQKSLGTKKR